MRNLKNAVTMLLSGHEGDLLGHAERLEERTKKGCHLASSKVFE